MTPQVSGLRMPSRALQRTVHSRAMAGRLELQSISRIETATSGITVRCLEVRHMVRVDLAAEQLAGSA